jgi:hypothetical protein
MKETKDAGDYKKKHTHTHTHTHIHTASTASKTFLEVDNYRIKGNFRPFMEPKYSLPCLQNTAINIYFESNQSNLNHHILFPYDPF